MNKEGVRDWDIERERESKTVSVYDMRNGLSRKLCQQGDNIRGALAVHICSLCLM